MPKLAIKMIILQKRRNKSKN